MKLQIIKDIECDDTGLLCDVDCDACCNAAGDAQWVVYYDGAYRRGSDCLEAGQALKQMRDENQSHRDFINEENEELTEALEKVGTLKELIEELIPLAFPKKIIYTAEQAGKMIALKERAAAAIKNDI